MNGRASRQHRRLGSARRATGQPEFDRRQFIADGNAALAALDPASIEGLFPDPEARQGQLQDRYNEENQGISLVHAIKAIFAMDWFWAIAALLPMNNLDDQKFGRRRHYPSWLLFGLAYCVSGLAQTPGRQAVAVHFQDEREWSRFADWVDQYVEDGWTLLSDIQRVDNTLKRPKAKAAGQRTSRTKARARRRHRALHLVPVASCPAPKNHHLDYFHALMTGVGNKKAAEAVSDPSSPWYRMPEKIRAAFRQAAVDQAQAMGVFDPSQPFQFQNPNPNQHLRFDGTVFKQPRRKHDDLCEDHHEGGKPKTVYGSKWTLASTRVAGQYHSRVYLDATHTGRAAASHHRDESQAVLAMAPALRDLANGGIKGVIVDSAVRGQAVITLQRDESLVVVNYPHAERNPDGGSGNRLNATRIEKSYLRKIATHGDNGTDCMQRIFAIGGELAQLVETVSKEQDSTTGAPKLTYALRPVETVDYKTRTNAARTAKRCTQTGCTDDQCEEMAHRRRPARREYLTVRVSCDATRDSFTTDLALFHTEPVTGDSPGADPNYNWGEVVRVFAPSTQRFRDLYGGRNDTESRHADLKRRLKYLPRDIHGQLVRLYGAMIAANAVAWQVHIQAHGLPNIFDNTA